jgi:hypothetical protein
MSAHPKRPSSPPSLKELRNIKRSKREAERVVERAATNDGWEKLDKTKYAFDFTETSGRAAFAVLNFPANTTRVDIFMRLFPKTLVDSIVHRLNTQDPHLLSWSRGATIGLSHEKIYKVLAARIRVQGEHSVPQRNIQNGKPQRDAFLAAIKHFRDTFGGSMPGIDVVERLHSVILISPAEEDEFSDCLLAALISIGQLAIGDEKLFKFGGLSHWVRQVLSKPAKLGLWTYMLCVKVQHYLTP